MSIFKPNKKPVEKRRPAELIFDHAGKTALAFGLHWRSIVTSDARKAGIAMARTQGATHYLFRGQQIGFGFIDAKSNPQLAAGATVYPAAQAAARQYGGDALFVLQVSPGDYWIALIRNGSPTSLDLFLVDSNDSQAIADAKSHLEAIGGDDARLTIYTNVENHGLAGVVKGASIDDILIAATNDEDRLLVMPKVAMSIPKPLIAVAVLGSLALIGQQGIKWWEAKQRAQLAAHNRVTNEDPALVWARVIADWEATKVSPGAAGLLAARESIGRLPVLWDGWTLSNAKCTAAPLSAPAKVRAWGCSASYERTAVSAKLNREMEPAIPPEWTVSFTPLKSMQVNWSVDEPINPLQIAGLKPTRFHSVDTSSRFQALAPAFSQELKFEFVAVNLPAPKQEDGTALPLDSVASSLREAVLSVRGPLRTIDALIVRDIPADWDSVGITFAVSNSSYSINSSAVSAEVSGVIYAKN